MKAQPKLSDEHLEGLRQKLRELVAEQAHSWDQAVDEDVEVEDEWVDWIDTYEDAIDGLGRLGIDPYDDPLDWIEFLDPLGGFERARLATSTDEERFIEYLAATYGGGR